MARRAEAARNADYLAQARIELDQLLAMKRLEADMGRELRFALLGGDDLRLGEFFDFDRA